MSKKYISRSPGGVWFLTWTAEDGLKLEANDKLSSVKEIACPREAACCCPDSAAWSPCHVEYPLFSVLCVSKSANAGDTIVLMHVVSERTPRVEVLARFDDLPSRSYHSFIGSSLCIDGETVFNPMYERIYGPLPIERAPTKTPVAPMLDKVPDDHAAIQVSYSFVKRREINPTVDHYSVNGRTGHTVVLPLANVQAMFTNLADYAKPYIHTNQGWVDNPILGRIEFDRGSRTLTIHVANSMPTKAVVEEVKRLGTTMLKDVVFGTADATPVVLSASHFRDADDMQRFRDTGVHCDGTCDGTCHENCYKCRCNDVLDGKVVAKHKFPPMYLPDYVKMVNPFPSPPMPIPIMFSVNVISIYNECDCGARWCAFN